MKRVRSHKNRTEHKLARAFRTHNLSNKSLLQQEEDFNLGLKTSSGDLKNISDIIRAISILDENSLLKADRKKVKISKILDKDFKYSISAIKKDIVRYECNEFFNYLCEEKI